MTEQADPQYISRLQSLCHTHWQNPIDAITLQSVSEFPLVRMDGRGVDVAMLWAYLKKGLTQIREANGMLSGLQGEDFKLTAGIGRSIVQIHSSTHSGLEALWNQQEALIERILATAKPRNLSLLTFGRQPTATPSRDQLTQKFEYFSVLQNLDSAWLPFSTTAHERLRILLPFEDRISALNLFQWLWPVFVALFGNDHIMGGEDHYQNHLFLRQVLRAKSPHFSVKTPPRMRELSTWIEYTLKSTMLTVRDEEGWAIAHKETFQEWLEQNTPSDDAIWSHWCDHLKYTFVPAQLCEDGSIELRYVAQQNKIFRKALHALCLGIALAHADIWNFIYAFSPDESRLDIRGLRMHEIVAQAMNHERDPSVALNRQLDKAIRFGLEAPQAFTGLIEGVLQHASDALLRKHSDAVKALEPLWIRLREKKGPPQKLRANFALRGMPVILEQYLL